MHLCQVPREFLPGLAVIKSQGNDQMKISPAPSLTECSHARAGVGLYVITSFNPQKSWWENRGGWKADTLKISNAHKTKLGTCLAGVQSLVEDSFPKW